MNLTRLMRGTPLLLACLTACTIYRGDEVRDDPGRPGEADTWSRDGQGSGETPGRGGSSSSGATPPVVVDRWKELLVIDRTVLGDARAKNDGAGPLSFRHLVEEAVGTATAPDAVRTWLGTWADSSLGAAARSGVTRELVCPWLRSSPENACDATCNDCAATRLDLARAPFELIAVVNRVDLATDGDPCSANAGELRFVYSAMRPGTRTPLPFTVVFEYDVQVDASEGAPGWASEWHALAKLPFGNAYTAALVGLTRRVTDRGPEAGGASTLAQVRTNEAAFGTPWELRNFALVADPLSMPRFALRGLPGTPRLDMNETSALADFIRDNREDIVLRGVNALPPSLWAPAAPIPSASFRWRAPEVGDPVAERAFSANTCSGCHGGERPADRLSFQHLAAPSSGYGGTTGTTQVSRYLNDPGRDDELTRRGRAMARLLGTTCPPPPADPPRDGGAYGARPEGTGATETRWPDTGALPHARVHRAH